MWKCKCVCGRIRIINAKHLYHPPVCLCGINKKHKPARHGKSHDRVYKIWGYMKSRCYYKNNVRFKNYGGRGITVCQRWMKFENFYKDMGAPPSVDHSINRINNNGNYNSNNCRWALAIEQANNRNNNRVIKFNGVNKTVSQWAREKNITKECLKYRLDAGWNIYDALHKKSIRA